MSSPSSPFKSKGGIGRLRNAVRYSVQGFKAAIREEAAFRQELLLILILLPVAFWIGQTPLQIVLLVVSLVCVLVVELLNSAIEAVADAISLETNPLLGRAKDLGSAAVMLSLMLAAGIWGFLLINHWFVML